MAGALRTLTAPLSSASRASISASSAARTASQRLPRPLRFGRGPDLCEEEPLKLLSMPGRDGASWLAMIVDDQDLYTIVITTYIPPRQVGDGPWTPWYADYYHPAV